MAPQVDVLQTFIKTAAVSGIAFVWVNFTIKSFKMAWHTISTSPEEEKLVKLPPAQVNNFKSIFMMNWKKDK